MEWVKLSEKEPEETGRYFVIWKTELKEQYAAYATYDGKCWMIEVEAYYFSWPCEITHYAKIEYPENIDNQENCDTI